MPTFKARTSPAASQKCFLGLTASEGAGGCSPGANPAGKRWNVSSGAAAGASSRHGPASGAAQAGAATQRIRIAAQKAGVAPTRLFRALETIVGCRLGAASVPERPPEARLLRDRVFRGGQR